MSRFNLVDEKWIPVRFPNGNRDELGIKDTLLRAKEIAAIEDSSPLVVASLHRFLLAVLYRALAVPTDIDQAKQLFKAGLPTNKITEEMIRKHGEVDSGCSMKNIRFFFWTVFNPNVPDGLIIETLVRVCTAEYNADKTNKVLFLSHRHEESPRERAKGMCSLAALYPCAFRSPGARLGVTYPSAITKCNGVYSSRK